MNRSVVINREYGSGGREVGRIVSERTGMQLYDTRILQEAASLRGLPPDQLASFDERVVTGQFFDLSILAGIDSETFSLPYRMYGAIADVITEAAQRAPSVFIGRCADRILRDAGLPFRSVFLYCTDLDRKIARAVEVDGVPRKDAERHIARMDKARERYQQFFTGTRFGDPREYDLCVNTARLGYRACAEIILDAVAAPGPEPRDEKETP